MHTHTYTCTHMDTHAHTHKHMHTYTCTHTHAHTWTHMHTHTNTCTHTHAHTYTHTYRPGSIQTRSQIEMVQQFALSLSPLWFVYPSPSSSLSLEGYLGNQHQLLHGTEQRKLKYIPNVS